MDLAIIVYLIGLFGSLADVISFVLVAFLCITGLMLVALPLIIDGKEDGLVIKNWYVKILKWVIIPAVLLWVVIPSKTDMYIMTGLIIGEKIITSEKGNELLDKSYLYIIDKIDTAIAENAETEEVKEDGK